MSEEAMPPAERAALQEPAPQGVAPVPADGEAKSGAAGSASEGSASKEEEYSSSDAEGGGDGESSSGDEDEKQPLSQRGAWAAKHELPEPTAPRRKRVDRLPRIRKSERCGKCENCLNPQRKKACTVARQRMLEQQAKEKGTQGGSAASAPAPAAVAVPGEDAFTRSLTTILSNTGGVVQERHVKLLLQLVQRARTKPHRTALLVVLQRSSAEVLRQAVAGKLLLELEGWLSEFVSEDKQVLVQKTLACLAKLPVTLQALQPPCKLGKIVGGLRKHPRFGSAVIEPAKRLVAHWKAVVEQEQAAKDKGKPAGSNGGSTSAATAPKAPAAPTAKPVAAGQGALERQASGHLASMTEGDLFGKTDKQRAGIKDAVPSVKKVVTVKTVTVEPTRGRPAEPAKSAGTPGPSSAAKDGTAAGSKPGGTASSNDPIASKVGTSPFASLGSLGSGVTVLGSSSGGLGALLSTVGPASSSAKERAAAAARRVPSPEPQPRKEKKKKVGWVLETKLVAVRWFRKDEPPAAVKQDADLTQLPWAGSDTAAAAAAAAREPSPPGFESAAKKEHLSEAEALRRYRAEEEEERSGLEQRLERMVSTTAWLNPMPNDALSEADLAAMTAPPARGEDSTEAAAAAARRQQVPPALYSSLAAVPPSPAEPSTVADHGVVQHPSTIPHIPLTLEEPPAMQQQEQQQPPLQQPPQQVVQLPPPPVAQPLQQQPPAVQPVFGQAAPSQGLQQQAATAVPDIGAALAQLAASGILGGVPGSAGGGGPAQQQHQQAPYAQQQQLQQQPPSFQRPTPPMQQLQQPPDAGQPPRGRPAPLPQPPAGQQRMQQGPPPAAGQGGWQQHGAGQQRPPGPPGPPPQRRGFNQRLCRYFNTPQGCFQGDRCNFAHITQTGSSENGRSGGGKRPAEVDDGMPGRQYKQPRTGW